MILMEPIPIEHRQRTEKSRANRSATVRSTNSNEEMNVETCCHLSRHADEQFVMRWVLKERGSRLVSVFKGLGQYS